MSEQDIGKRATPLPTSVRVTLVGLVLFVAGLVLTIIGVLST